MAFTCGFFNSVAHDRKYDAVQHGMIFDGIITDGIYATYLKAMVVKASENASEVIVQPGRAWFNHTWSYNDSDYPVAAPEPEVVLDRIDTLVLDINSEDAVRNNQFLWVQGTPTSQTPEPPELIHTATHNQYPLCDVYRQAGTTMIYAADITNRVGTSDCPFVTGVLESIDIDDLLAQWDDEFHTWENATKASFEGWMLNQQSVYTAWFNALKTQMAGDVADVEAWVQTIKDIIDEETATHLQLEIDEINSMLPSGSHITVTTSDTELYSRTVTITDEDNNTVTSQFDANGVAVFKTVPYVGNLTITSTDGVRTATEVVNTPYFARYEFTLAFWSATVNIIGDSVFGGDTVTITDSTTALVGTVVLNASGAGVFNATYPDTYKFSVTHGGETMEVSLAVTQETTYNVEIHAGLNYQAWLNAGRVSKSFSSLDEVLEDEKTLRQLFLVHDAVDYVASQRVNNDLTKIFNTDLAAKWINNSDYALEKFYAVADIKTVMDTADKYGYGEWVITDSTTTPPTWGAKGNVPVMTANTAPYGTAGATTTYSSTYDAFHAFDGVVGINTISWSAGSTSNAILYYKFTNPICPRRFLLLPEKSTGNSVSTKTWDIVASNDGSNWEVLYSGENEDEYEEVIDSIENDNYYLYVGARIKTSYRSNSYSVSKLQFYGRELKVSVPTMTSNTAPFGEASASSTYSSDYPAWHAFSPSERYGWGASSSSLTNAWCRYDFTSPMVIKAFYAKMVDSSYLNDMKVQGLVNNEWVDFLTFSVSASGEKVFAVENANNVICSSFRVFGTTNTSGGGYKFNFYGKDYSEKEFEVGTTKKWLYDHGVELETLETFKGSSTTSSVSLNDSGQIYFEPLNGTNSNYNNFNGVGKTIDVTNFNLISCVLGDKCIMSNGNAGCVDVWSAKPVSVYSSSNRLATIDIITPILSPRNIGLNVTSINGEYFVAVNVTYYNGRSFSISELWLE